MTDQQQLLQHLIKSAIEGVKKTFIFKEEDLRDTLPDDYTYNIESLSSEPSKFKARLVSRTKKPSQPAICAFLKEEPVTFD